MLDMLVRHFKKRVPIHNTLFELQAKEKNKKKKQRLQSLYLTDDEMELLSAIVKALKIVSGGSKILCGNDVTLSSADRVR